LSGLEKYHRNFFFLICHRANEILSGLKKILSEKYLFYLCGVALISQH